jgi:hypothetical protein
MQPDPLQPPNNADRPMDSEEERDFVNHGPLTDMDTEENTQIIATLLKHTPSCMNTAGIEQQQLSNCKTFNLAFPCSRQPWFQSG